MNEQKASFSAHSYEENSELPEFIHSPTRIKFRNTNELLFFSFIHTPTVMARRNLYHFLWDCLSCIPYNAVNKKAVFLLSPGLKQLRARKAGMKIGDIEGVSVAHDARRASTKSFKHFKWHITSLLRYWFLK